MNYGLKRLWEHLPSPVKVWETEVRGLSMWTPKSNGLGLDYSLPTYCVGDLGKISFYASFFNEDSIGNCFM